MKKLKKPSRATQLTAQTYENNKHNSSPDINIRLTDQMLKIAHAEALLTELVAKVKQTRTLIEAEKAVLNGLRAILDLRRLMEGKMIVDCKRCGAPVNISIQEYKGPRKHSCWDCSHFDSEPSVNQKRRDRW